ncbi:hypothetical protein JKF63_06797 [Porcisia hertigi]|uniref:SAC domain-containing protein n=1 Tax=Porcisia hertigi TaxID=2761500 RepID=A0A836IWZ4_9TRYP|nr:hypothetical protein JKF63_06797 [Porcisia hertigi]
MNSYGASVLSYGSQGRPRCAIAVRNYMQYLFVVVPKPKPPPKVELEPLMFFETPTPPPQAEPSTRQTQCMYAPKQDNVDDSWVIPLEFNGSGELKRSVVFPATEFASLTEVRRRCGPFASFQEYPALFGCLRIDKVYVLVATDVTPAVRLPFAGVIYNVQGTAWVPFEIPGVAPVRVTASCRARLHEFQKYTYNKGFYYSDDVDLLLPFPFTKPEACAPPDLACDWSHHLREPFSACSLPLACSVLVRGFAGERVCALKEGVELHLVLLGRQSNVNPGPRYLGRGLNSANGAGNDHYYEYILWKYHGADTVTFTRYSLLRGTIPVHWATQMSISLSEPTMIFSRDRAEVLRGSTAYFEHTFQKLKNVMLLDTNGRSIADPQLRCINLLRLNPQNGEDALSRHYLDAVRSSKAAIKQKFPSGELDLVHVDWLNLIKEYSIDVATSTFWEASMAFLSKSATTEDSIITVGMLRRNGEVDRLITQSRFLRLNCADSLDRTNLGCFFTCLQISIAMLITQRIPFSSFPHSPPVPSLNASDETNPDGGSATPFASMRGGMHPTPHPFLTTWNEARDPQRIPPAIVRALAELFVHNGDCVAMLYTNSAAMHGNILRGVCGMRMQGHNALIATQRKFENVFEDQNKFRSIELLLGRNRSDHFPSISEIFLLRPVPYAQWVCAVVVVCVPHTVTTREVEVTVRRTWDTKVMPQLLARHLPPIESSALSFTVTMHKASAKQEHDELLESMRQVTFDGVSSPAEDSLEDKMPEGENTFAAGNRLAVIEFDPDLCRAVDAVTLLRQQSFLSLGGTCCHLAPYAYPLQTSNDNNLMTGAVKHVGTSLKRGLTSLMRSLN